MKKSVSLGIAAIAVVLLAALIVLPVTGVGTSTTAVTTLSEATGALNAKPFISSTVSSTSSSVGTPVTISGVATGGDLTSGVQFWLFSGGNAEVTIERVKADGTFSKTYPTTGFFPPATYYVFVQSPGTDGKFDISLINSGEYYGKVFNTKTNVTIFNFAGTSSVQDSAALKALSDALNQPGQDDVYTTLTFKLIAPVATSESAKTTAAATVATTAASTAAPTAKSPLPFGITGSALVISGCCAAYSMRKIH